MTEDKLPIGYAFNTKRIVDVEKALEEKRAMQKVFTSEHGYSSSVLTLVIEHFEGELKK